MGTTPTNPEKGTARIFTEIMGLKPAPAADASETWPENAAAHNEAQKALIDLFNLEHTPEQTGATWDRLAEIGQTMPRTATVSAVYESEHTVEHIHVTLRWSDGQLTAVFDGYGPFDHERANAPRDTETLYIRLNETDAGVIPAPTS